MPYIQDPLLKAKQDEEALQQGGQVQLTGGNSTVNNSEQGAPQKQNQNTGSNFQNLDSYLNVNDANKYSQNFANRVQGDISGARSKINQASSNVIGQIGQTGQVVGKDQINQAIQDPSKADASQYKSWINQQYTGPMSLQDNQAAASQQQGAVNSARAKANLAGSTGGRFQLLDSYVGRPSFTSGEKSLDNLLIQRGNALNANALKAQAASVGAYGKNQENQIQKAAQERSKAVSDTSTIARQSLGDAVSGIQDEVGKNVTKLNQQNQDVFNSLRDNIGSGKLSVEDYGRLGLDPETNLWNVDATKYLSAPKTATTSNAMSKEQAARYKALLGLNDLSNTFAPDLDQAGTYQGFNVDKAGLSGAINSAENEYFSKINPARDQISKLDDDISALFSKSRRQNSLDPKVQAQMNNDIKNKQYERAALEQQIKELAAQYGAR